MKSYLVDIDLAVQSNRSLLPYIHLLGRQGHGFEGKTTDNQSAVFRGFISNLSELEKICKDLEHIGGYYRCTVRVML